MMVPMVASGDGGFVEAMEGTYATKLHETCCAFFFFMDGCALDASDPVSTLLPWLALVFSCKVLYVPCTLYSAVELRKEGEREYR